MLDNASAHASDISIHKLKSIGITTIVMASLAAEKTNRKYVGIVIIKIRRKKTKND